jgi:DNA-binding NtrC family response regulator
MLGWLHGPEPVAAIMTEHVLHTASGVSLLETARSCRPNARRVLMTTYHDLPSIVAGLHSGAIERLVQKPFTAAELLGAILPESAAESTNQRASA